MSHDDELLSFGLAVRAFREAKKISQEELAATADLHRTYIGSIERGERNLGLKNIFRIARALGCEPSQLVASTDRRADK